MKKVVKKITSIAVCTLMLGSAMLPQTGLTKLTDNFSITASAEISTSSTLKNGSRGTQVKYLQMNLNVLNYNAGSADGIFGNGTKSAVIRFQRAYGLSADGIAGKNTINKMNTVAKQLQNNLNSLGYSCGTADGILGTNTVNAIKRFQKAYGLSADGIAGPQTMNKINSVKAAKAAAASNGAKTGAATATNKASNTNIRSTIASLANSYNGTKGTVYQNWAKLGRNDAWCVAYATYLANQAIKKNGASTSLTPTSGSEIKHIVYLARWFRNKGRYYSFVSWKSTSTGKTMDKTCSSVYNYTPKVGDIAAIDTDYNFANAPEHAGVVIAVNGSTITLSEGNTGGSTNANNSVHKCTYKRNKDGYWQRTDYAPSKITGFASPNY